MKKCAYCGFEFGLIFIDKRGRTRVQTKSRDHVIPSQYADGLTRNFMRRPNIVDACNVCNSIKSDKMFDNFASAAKFVSLRRIELGLILVSADDSSTNKSDLKEFMAWYLCHDDASYNDIVIFACENALTFDEITLLVKFYGITLLVSDKIEGI